MSSRAEGASPAMAQWFELKKDHPDALLFFRMGDFYELFFEDAEKAAAALDIALTARGRHQDKPIPMCGVPVHTAPTYLARLVRRGFRIAIAEQIESATERKDSPAKGPLKRGIVRIVTPGTLTEDELLDPTRTNLLMAIVPHSQHNRKKLRDTTQLGLAWVDVSTGLFETCSLPLSSLNDILARLEPAEILAPPDILLPELASRLTPEASRLTLAHAQSVLSDLYGIASLESYGHFSDEEIMAAAIVVEYVKRSQAGQLPRLPPPLPQSLNGVMGIDPSTRASLDILRNREGDTRFTLFECTNYCVTAAGARLLSTWLSAPATDIAVIKARQEGWLYLASLPHGLSGIQDILKEVPDMSRALSRLSLKRGQPRDLAALRNGLHATRHIFQTLEKNILRHTITPPSAIDKAVKAFEGSQKLQAELTKALIEAPPARMEDGDVIAEGYDHALDNERTLRDNSRQILADLQKRYAEHYGVTTLKIRHHSQLGYIMEAPVSAAEHLKAHSELIMRQGTTTLVRFSTEELIALDRGIHEATERAKQQEKIIFDKLVAMALTDTELPEIIDQLALVDVLQSSATLQQKKLWCCPSLHSDTRFVLTACRHPVVESALKHTERFTPNDCNLTGSHRVMLLTGPNMAGKSTFLRQAALAIILAQSGLPLPAQKAEIGIVDRLFSRVGAADDLANGQSTFMMEMTETASILNVAGPRSFVVVDEIGRGTATLDGLAIAYAVLESLHSTIGCRTIFATHFHELSVMSESLKNLKPFTMKVQEWQEKVVFLHEVVTGTATKSWGIHVAKLAGVPHKVVTRAQDVLVKLENKHNLYNNALPLFNHTAQPKQDSTSEKLRESILTLDPNSLSPRQALEELYRLKGFVD